MNDSYEDMVRTDNRIVLFLGALFAVFMLSMVFVSATSITDGLEAYYKLDETTGLIATDFSGNGNDGTMEGYTFNHGEINGGVTIEDEAMKFNGTTGYVDAGDSNAFSTNNNQITWNFWVYKYQDIEDGTILGKYSTTASQREYIIKGSATNIDLRIYLSNEGTSANYSNQVLNGTSFDANVWTNFAIVFNGDENKIYNYKNGNLVGTNTNSALNKIFNSTTPLYIGNSVSTTGVYEGKIDSVQIYNKALTENEISAQYEAGRGSYALSGDGLVAQYSGRDYNATHILDSNPVVEGATENTLQGKRFVGTTTGIIIPGSNNLRITDGTISLWSKTHSIHSGNNYILTKQNYRLRETTARKTGVYLIGSEGNAWFDCSTTKTINEWYNTTVIFNNTDINIYQNGINCLSQTHSLGTIQTDDGNLFLNSISSFGFNGSLDEVGIWSRALSEDEIQYLYESSPHAQTSFESEQVSGTTDTNITLTCNAVNGCKAINYNIDNNEWVNTTNSNFYSFLYSGSGDHNIQYFSTDNSDNNETTKTSNFKTYGNGRFYFKDENSGSDLTGVQVNFNGTDYDSGANNYLDFNFQTFPSTNTTYLFTLSKAGYSTRYYQTDLNYFSDFNITFALIPDTLDTDIQFKMFPPTGSSVLANTYIEFKDKDTNYTITRLKSNSEGELTANLRSDDQNYLVWISEGTYIYQAVQLTILYPKDEQTLNNITGNWRIEITDNISYQDLNIPEGTNKIIYLLPNTKYPFTIAVQDTAGTYFKRKWSKIYQGNPLTDTLQPYLVNADDGIAVKFVFQDPKRDSIENIIINIYKNVGGVKTLISSGASDVTGNALFFLIAGDKYWLEFTYNGIIIFETQNYTVTSSTVYWTINLSTREIKTIDGTFINVIFNPIQDYILKDATSISYKITASGLNRTRAEFYVLEDGNKVITYTRDASCTTPCTVTIPITDLNISIGDKVYLDLNVYIDSNNYVFSYKKAWSYGTTSNIDTHDLFVKARTDFGCSTDTMLPCPLTSIVSIVIMILLLGSMVFTFNFVNPKGLLVAGVGILAVFTYLGWFWWVALVLIVIASIFYLRGD